METNGAVGEGDREEEVREPPGSLACRLSEALGGA